ncbi:MAG TPA: type I-C CRISPR-associated protein Cas7/Csd2 [Opitutaceae bacterium]|nr:type I-C CRISPR-associated protein Cas7/Csd2 [Opitutaceae bacterium]
MNHRYDFVFLFDAQDSNPNGDPDAGNLPRVDPETGHGLVTDVCLKRKIRNFVQLTKADLPGYEIYVREKAVLNQQHQRAYTARSLDPKKAKAPDVESVRQWMCENFFDIRTFGAVMSTDVNCGQVRGPVQLTFARSISPIVSLEHAVTRCAVTTDREAEKQDGDNRTMGRKFTIPYGLYRAHGFINPFLADAARKGTGFSEDDLAVFRTAIGQMFEFDRSAARGLMGAKRCIAFKHATALGSAPAHKLFESVTVEKKPGVEAPRAYADYDVRIDSSAIPPGVTVEEWI